MSSTARSHLPYNPHSPSVSPLKRKAMSVTQTYYLAHTARGKLSSEAARSDHDLRLLVGHANLLDSLMLELAEAEQEQESWFNQSVKKAAKTSEEPRHIQWADSVVEEPEEDWQAEDADSSDDEYDSEEEIEMEAHMAALQRVTSHQITEVEEDDDEEFEDDGEEDYAALQLTLSPSHSASPPELDHDSDSSEDEAMPPSPPSDSLPTFSEKQRQQIATTSFYSKPAAPAVSIPPSEQQAFFDDGFYLPQRTPSLVNSISVY
ncbi:hypothetical protein HYALB_00012107 [Hymenoscyphus albidus]|uniref:Uncharacterized protein n=1 Tax=Hymenoscyphus albidus TaxID=595503 RepID=A0A9N9Q4A6_9HELO|nr:hypothetical protein HYALB_00012107 [Hymenoscyphus albidus]